MRVAEIFHGIQGESTYAGLPCSFVRLTGCNLRCSYCDTTYAYEGGEEMSLVDIISRFDRFGKGMVEITGGEPLLDQHATELTGLLLEGGRTVLVETNGSMDIGVLPGGAIAVMDVKTPGSGMCESFLHENISRLRPTDEVKFVVTGLEDYKWSRRFIKENRLEDICTVLLSPLYGVVEPSALAGWMLEDGVKARLNLQLHKYIYGPDKRGV